MFKSTKTKIITLALVGVVALGGAIYATSALAVGGASAAPATALSAQTATDSQLRASILDMLKDRMRLTGANAETFADQMMARVQTVNPNFDLQDMVNWCSQFINANANGRGMMGGNASAYGRGMMGAGTTLNAGSTNPSGTSPQNRASNSAPRGMMGSRGMMGTSGVR